MPTESEEQLAFLVEVICEASACPRTGIGDFLDSLVATAEDAIAQIEQTEEMGSP